MPMPTMWRLSRSAPSGNTSANLSSNSPQGCKYNLLLYICKDIYPLLSCSPPKQLITEERITAHFSGLQISGDANGVGSGRSPGHHHHNNNSLTTTVNGGLATDDIPSTSTGKTHHPNPAYQMAAMELEQKLRNANRIVICDELKQNVSPVTTVGAIPPEWLLKSIPRPCTALVPWQPSPLQLTGVHHTLAKDTATTQDRLHHSGMPTGGGVQTGNAGGAGPGAAGAGGVDLEDYDDDLQFFENNNTCNVNLNKSDEQMDEDL